jgi:hypothetical protein
VATNSGTDIFSQALGGTDLTRGLSDVITAVAGQLDASQVNGTGTQAVATQLDQLRNTSQLQVDAVTDNTRALLANTSAQGSSSGSSALQTAGSIASQVLGGGLGLAPLITGLIGLFGGGQASTPPPLTVYTPPQTVNFDGEVSRTANSTDWTASQGTQAGTPTPASTPQITVQVNAMDSKSFMDHSQEIALAVRQAMLNSHSLNDVVNDL